MHVDANGTAYSKSAWPVMINRALVLTGNRVLVHAGELDRAPSTGAGLTTAAGTCLPGVCGVGLVMWE